MTALYRIIKKERKNTSECVTASLPNRSSIRSNLASREAIIPYASFSISHAESSQIQLIFSGHEEEMVIKYSASGGNGSDGGGGSGGEGWSVN